LSPIGQYRATNIAPSKGKRSKKRKRQKKLKEEDPNVSRPPPPEVLSFVVVGLNSITRSLESLSQKSKALKIADCEKNDAGQSTATLASKVKGEKNPASQVLQSSVSGAKDNASSSTEKPPNDDGQIIQPLISEAKSSGARNEASNNTVKPLESDHEIVRPGTSKPRSRKRAADHAFGARSETAKDREEPLKEGENLNHHFSAILVPRSSQPSTLHAHLPQLIATASLAYPELPATRLVQLPKGCDARLCEALGLPRVSFIGILDGAPHSKSLVDLVRECVPEIEIPWLQEAKKAVYLPVKINAIETFVPVAKKEQKVVA
jgi:hypothetical protein